jgi:gliding motility-associated lipoprotein GldD
MNKLGYLTGIFVFLIGLLGLTSCQNYTPKPRSYFRIHLADKTYQRSDSNKVYSFEYPKNIAFIQKNPKDTAWFDIVYPTYNARIYFSYKEIDNNFQEIAEDSRNFVYKHAFKADAIIENPYEDPTQNVYGIMYEIKGNTASSVQFLVTDSTHHFLRGALYFNNRPNKDSLAPVISYISDDIRHIMETVNWK